MHVYKSEGDRGDSCQGGGRRFPLLALPFREIIKQGKIGAKFVPTHPNVNSFLHICTVQSNYVMLNYCTCDYHSAYFQLVIAQAIVNSTQCLSLSTSESSVLPQPDNIPGVATSILHAANCSVKELLQRGASTTIMKREPFSPAISNKFQ